MDGRDLATIAPAPPDCGECRDQVILANLAWCFAHGYRFSASREFMVNDDDGFSVQLLDEAGLTPATRAA